MYGLQRMGDAVMQIEQVLSAILSDERLGALKPS